jgi:hypothetical protein
MFVSQGNWFDETLIDHFFAVARRRRLCAVLMVSIPNILIWLLVGARWGGPVAVVVSAKSNGQLRARRELTNDRRSQWSIASRNSSSCSQIGVPAMRVKTLLTVLVLIGGFGTGRALAQDGHRTPAPFAEWITYTSTDGGFAVRFPMQPKLSRSSTRDGGPGTNRNGVSVDTNDGHHFEVTYVHYPGGVSSPDGMETSVLTGTANVMVENGAQLVSQREVNYGACSGQEATVRITDPKTKLPMLGKMRTLFANDILYYLLFGGIAESPAETEMADRFLDSFSLRGPCTVKPATLVVMASERTRLTGALDPVSGWQRFHPPYAIEFMFPAGGELHAEDLQGSEGSIKHLTYRYEDPDNQLTVEVYDGYPTAGRKTPGMQSAALAGTGIGTRHNVEASGFMMAEGTAAVLGDLTGREYALSQTSGEARGRIRIFVTPARTYVLTAIWRDVPANQEKYARFFASVKIKP